MGEQSRRDWHFCRRGCPYRLGNCDLAAFRHVRDGGGFPYSRKPWFRLEFLRRDLFRPRGFGTRFGDGRRDRESAKNSSRGRRLGRSPIRFALRWGDADVAHRRKKERHQRTPRHSASCRQHGQPCWRRLDHCALCVSPEHFNRWNRFRLAWRLGSHSFCCRPRFLYARLDGQNSPEVCHAVCGIDCSRCRFACSRGDQLLAFRRGRAGDVSEIALARRRASIDPFSVPVRRADENCFQRFFRKGPLRQDHADTSRLQWIHHHGLGNCPGIFSDAAD